MAVHFLAEVLSTRSEIEDEMEVLGHALQKGIIELVSNSCFFPNNLALVLEVGKLVNNLFLFVFFLSLLLPNERFG